MNLRKLLCGLLALCLLMTLAPAALMEAEIEAPVDEVVEELGGEEAEEALISGVGYDDGDPDPAQNTNLTLFWCGVDPSLTQTKSFTYNTRVYATTDYDVVRVTPNKANNGARTITVTPLRTGDCTVTVKSANSDATLAILNVKVTGIGATKVHIGEAVLDGERIDLDNTTSDEITGTVNKDLAEFADGTYYLNADIDADVTGSDYEYYNNDIKDYVRGANRRFTWKSSNTSVLKLSKPGSSDYVQGQTDSKNEWVKAEALKAGTAKVTVTSSNGTKTTVTFKISDNGKAKKIKIVPDADDVDDAFDAKTQSYNLAYYGVPAYQNFLLLSAEVTPDTVYHNVTWTLSSTKLCYFTSNDLPADNPANPRPGQVKAKRENVSNREPIVLFFKGGTGTVKITAKTGNVSTTYTLKIVKRRPPIIAVNGTWASATQRDWLQTYNDVDLWYYKGWTKTKKIENSFVELECWLDIDNPAQDKALKWETSDKKIATISTKANKKIARVTFKKAGTVTITVTASTGLKNSVVFRVHDNAPEKIYFIDADGIEMDEIVLKKGQKAAVGVMIDTKSGSFTMWQEFYGMTFSKCKKNGSSTSSNYVSVNSKGVITAKNVGTGYVKVKSYNGKTAILKVKVTK